MKFNDKRMLLIIKHRDGEMRLNVPHGQFSYACFDNGGGLLSITNESGLSEDFLPDFELDANKIEIELFEGK